MKNLNMIQCNGNYVQKIIEGDFMQDNQRQAHQIAYIAGLFDGEGSICYAKSSTKRFMEMTNRKNPLYRAFVRIGMVKLPPLLLINEIFPEGYIHCDGVRKDRPTYQLMYRWEMFKREPLKVFLRTLLPYFIVKKPQAEILLGVLESYAPPKNRKLGFDLEEIQLKEEAYLKMRKLNAVGAATETNQSEIRKNQVIVRTLQETARMRRRNSALPTIQEKCV